MVENPNGTSQQQSFEDTTSDMLIEQAVAASATGHPETAEAMIQELKSRGHEVHQLTKGGILLKRN